MSARVDVEYAGVAAGLVDSITRANKGTLPKDVVRRLKNLPVLLQTAGLAATIAFCASRANDKDPTGRAYRVVTDALRTDAAASLGIAMDTVGFFAGIADADTASLALATARTRTLAMWLRRLADAVDKEQRPADPEGS